MTDNAPGWQPDPTGKHEHRYWDGSQWTDNVADAGVASTDPFVAPTEATPTIDEPTEPAPVDPTLADAPPPPDDPTAAWAAAPPPPAAYDPSGPIEPADGSKKGLLLIGGVVAAIVIAAIAFFALSGDDDGDDETVTDTTTTTEDGGDESTTTTGDDTTTTGDGAGAGDLRQACEDGDFVACDDLYFGSDIGSDDEEFGSTCGGRAEPQNGFCEETNGGEDDIGDDFGGGIDASDLADLYESQLGLTREQAECLADKVVDEDGQVNIADEDDAAAQVFDFLSDCDISMSDLTPLTNP